MALSGAVPPAFAHDVTFDLYGDGNIGVVFRYSDGTPMAGAAYRAARPDGGAPVADGRTDADGAAAFHAGDGRWRVDVDDGQGHSRRVKIDVQRGLPSAGWRVPTWVAVASLAANILLGERLIRRWRASRLQAGIPAGRA